MKKSIFVLLLILLVTACETTNNHKRGSVRTIQQSVEKEIASTQVKNSKETQIAAMPDVSVFFPEIVEENKKYSSSIWGVERKSLYADSKASIVGDIVFVQIKEAASAKIDDSRTRTGFANYLGEPEVSQTVFVRKDSVRGDYGQFKSGQINSTNTQNNNNNRPASDSFNGNSSSNASFAFEGQIAARIIGTDRFGNLFLKGTKTVLLNNEIAILELSGYIRSQDVKGDNTIDSELIENMEFLYNGALYVRQPVSNKVLGSNTELLIMTPVDDKETSSKKI